MCDKLYRGSAPDSRGESEREQSLFRVTQEVMGNLVERNMFVCVTRKYQGEVSISLRQEVPDWGVIHMRVFKVEKH